MNVIVTHEQADFDALASMLAVWLLHPDYHLIRPKRINRNLSAFFQDYKQDFCFQLWNKTNTTPIKKIMIVDSQTLNAMTGQSDTTEISVIDHHQPRANLPENWHCIFDRTGACTTILVERLRKENVTPAPIQATLLLMGIYEDTGNLTYGSTTVRDFSAATWLIENGADLNVLGQYLNQPLTEAQQLLTERLLQSCESLTVMGEKVVIAVADGRDINDEFSTVAHHLRDMLSPDVIFLLIGTYSGIRLIGRATNDRIDVGQMMNRFNGGGHTRAAAGLVLFEKGEKDQPIDQKIAEIRESLLSMLPGFITPPVTVGQIMSTRPLVLNEEMTIEEIDSLMQRYGYEGYPVVRSDGELIGLLNRRSVERALSLGLRPSIEMMMDAGSIFVRAGDAVDSLKEVMTLSGWGQIPVMSDDGKEMIGIVTRTDLIKILTSRTSVPGNRNYAAALKKNLPAGQLALIQMVAEVAYACHYPVYIVGGFVRDLILGLPVIDFDIVVEGDAIHLAKLLVSRYGGKLRTHTQFGTAKWALCDASLPLPADAKIPGSFDFISARTEFYDYPTAMPKVERSSIKLDLHRRDFTINTLALRLDGEFFGDLLDFWGGYLDIQQRLIRVLHSLSFADDPTRMLRAVRFEQRFGFLLEKQTMKLLKEARPLLKQVSGRRLFNELEAFFHEQNPSMGLFRLEELDLFTSIHPSIRWNRESEQHVLKLIYEKKPDFWIDTIPNIEAFAQGDGKYAVWWGNYSVDAIEEIAKRLQLSQKTKVMIQGVSLLCAKTEELSNAWHSDLTFFFEKLPLESIFCYDCIVGEGKLALQIQQYVTHWRFIRPYTDGQRLKALPYPPGEWMAAALKRLRKGWIDEEISTQAEEEKALKAFLTHYFRKRAEK